MRLWFHWLVWEIPLWADVVVRKGLTRDSFFWPRMHLGFKLQDLSMWLCDNTGWILPADRRLSPEQAELRAQFDAKLAGLSSIMKSWEAKEGQVSIPELWDEEEKR